MAAEAPPGMIVPCDLCGAGDAIPLPQDRRIGVCRGCGFVYVPERRSAAGIAAAWGHVYTGGLYDPEWPGVKARLCYVAEWLDREIGLHGRTLLDIGAGRGGFLKLAAERGASVTGLEPDGGNAMAASRHGACLHGTVETALIAERFDLITVLWTLENCGDCLAMLRQARQWLAPGGHVAVATGSRILVPFKKPLSSYLSAALPADLHCYRWSAASLCRALALAGMVASRVNDYRDRDELVMLAAADGETATTGPCDDPREILDHFRRWQEQFP